MILTIAIILLVAFLILLVMGIMKTSAWREKAQRQMDEEFTDGIESWITKEEKLMKEEEPKAQSGHILRAARPVNMAGVLGVVIVGAIILFLGIYSWTPSQVREYRVQIGVQGIYQVRGVVQYGQDFIAYQSVDGKEAIEICNEMNAELMKDRGGVLRNGKVAWRQ